MTLIRPLRDADLPILRAWMESTPEAPAWSERHLASLVAPPEKEPRLIRRGWMAVEEPAGPAGFLVATALHIPGAAAECEIEFVMTAPSARRRGVARALVETVFVWGRELAAEEIRLEVRASNAGALRFYEHCGFGIVGRRPGYYTAPAEDAVLMRCPLMQPRIMTP